MSSKRKRDDPQVFAQKRPRKGPRKGGYKKWAIGVRSYKRPWVEGLGGYYVGGYARGSARLPGVGKVSAGVGAGYYKGGDRAMDRLAGLGAYSHSRVRRNALLRPDPPMMANVLRGDENSTVIRHREFVTNIYSSDVAGQFKIQTFPINPAMPLLFPWLSTVAQNFEEYQFEGLCAEFQSTASDAIASSTNLALGSLMMVTQYDVENPPFSNAQALLNYDWSQSCKVSETALHFIECDPRQNVMSKLFTRNPTESTTDLRFTDQGNFSIATEGLQGTNVLIGRLWVSYQVRLSKPKIGSGPTVAGNYFQARNYSGTVALNNPFGTISEIEYMPENTLEIGLTDVGADGVITFPVLPTPSTYYVMYVLRHDSTTVSSTGIAFTNPEGCEPLKIWDDLTQEYLPAPPNGAVTTRSVRATFVDVPGGSSATIKVNTNYVYANGEMDILVMSVPYLSPNTYGG